MEARVEGLGRGPDDYLVKPFAAHGPQARVNANIQVATACQEAARSVMRLEQLTLALSTKRISVFEWDVKSNNEVVHGPFVEAFGAPLVDAARGMPLVAFLSAVYAEDIEAVNKVITAAVETEELWRMRR